jgi:hypothetical protein
LSTPSAPHPAPHPLHHTTPATPGGDSNKTKSWPPQWKCVML